MGSNINVFQAAFRKPHNSELSEALKQFGDIEKFAANIAPQENQYIASRKINTKGPLVQEMFKNGIRNAFSPRILSSTFIHPRHQGVSGVISE